MSLDKVSKFAAALLDFHNNFAKLNELLAKVEDLIVLYSENPEFHAFLCNAAISIADKKKFVGEMFAMFKLGPSFINTIHLMLDYQQGAFLESFFWALKQQIFDKLEIKNVYISSSVALKKEQKEELESKLKLRIKKNLVFKYSIDKDLVIGIKVKIDDYSEEYSLATQLQKISESLSELYIK